MPNNTGTPIAVVGEGYVEQLKSRLIIIAIKIYCKLQICLSMFVWDMIAKKCCITIGLFI